MLKKFDAIEYLVKKYVDDGEHATIPVYLENKDDFFNKFDPTDTSLAPEIYEYLDKCSYNIPVQYKIRIDIVCNDLDKQTQTKMQDAVRHHYGLKVFDNDIDLKINTRKSLILAIIGTLFLAFVYLGQMIDFMNAIAGTAIGILREILVVTGWVFEWYAIEKATFDRRALIENRKDNAQLFNAKFLFENENEYYKILEKEQQEDVVEAEEYEEIRDSFLDQ